MPPRNPVIRPTAEAGVSRKDRAYDALLEFRARRLQRRLDDLERTNPTDIPAASFATTTQLVTGQAAVPSNKKQTGNVRKILYARKTLKDWLEELPSDPRPPYMDAVAPVPLHPPRNLCSSCGYIGTYKCERCGELSCDVTCLDTHARDGGCGVR